MRTIDCPRLTALWSGIVAWRQILPFRCPRRPTWLSSLPLLPFTHHLLPIIASLWLHTEVQSQNKEKWTKACTRALRNHSRTHNSEISSFGEGWEWGKSKIKIKRNEKAKPWKDCREKDAEEFAASLQYKTNTNEITIRPQQHLLSVLKTKWMKSEHRDV